MEIRLARLSVIRARDKEVRRDAAPIQEPPEFRYEIRVEKVRVQGSAQRRRRMIDARDAVHHQAVVGRRPLTRAVADRVH